MKNTSIALGTLLLTGSILLFSCTENAKDNKTGNSAANTNVSTSGRIAYVNIDSLEANFEYLKNEKIKFEQRQAGMKAELERSAQQFQNDYTTFQRKAQANMVSEAEGKATEKRLMQMQQSLKTREEALTVQLMKEQEVFNTKLQAQLDKFLEEFNKDKKFDYIFSYSKGGPIMFANKELDVTAEVLKGMNEQTKNMGDTEKQK